MAPPSGASVRSGTARYTVHFGVSDALHPDTADSVVYKGRRVPKGGCHGEAMSAPADRYGDPSAAQTASTIANDSYTGSTKDPAVRKAVGAWSGCMKGKGYSCPTPMAALGDQRFLKGAAPSAREVATAEADMACKDATGLLGAWFSAEGRLQRALIARQRTAPDGLSTAHAAEVAAARKIVSAG